MRDMLDTMTIAGDSVPSEMATDVARR